MQSLSDLLGSLLPSSTTNMSTTTSANTESASKVSIAHSLNQEDFYNPRLQRLVAASVLDQVELHPSLARPKYPFYWKPQVVRAETLLTIFVWHNVEICVLDRLWIALERRAALQATVQALLRMQPNCKHRAMKWLLDHCDIWQVDASELEGVLEVLEKEAAKKAVAKVEVKKPKKVVHTVRPLRVPVTTPDIHYVAAFQGGPTANQTKRQISFILNEDAFYKEPTRISTATFILSKLKDHPQLANHKFPFFFKENRGARAGTPLAIFLWFNLGPAIYQETLQLYPDPKLALVKAMKGLANLLNVTYEQVTLPEEVLLWVVDQCVEWELDPSLLINALLANRAELKGDRKLEEEAMDHILALQPPPSLDFAIFFRDGSMSMDQLEQLARTHPLYKTELVLSLPKRQVFQFTDQWVGISGQFVPQLLSLECSPTEWTVEGWVGFWQAIGQSTRLERLKIKANFAWVAASEEACTALKNFFHHKPSQLQTLKLVDFTQVDFRDIRRVRIFMGSATQAFQSMWEGMAAAMEANGSPVIDKLHLSGFDTLPSRFVAQLTSGGLVRELHLHKNRLSNCDWCGPAVSAEKSNTWKALATPSLDVTAKYNGTGGLTELTLAANSNAGLTGTDVTQGIISLMRDEPLEKLHVTAKSSHYEFRHTHRHTHHLEVTPFLQALQQHSATLKSLGLIGVHLCHADPKRISAEFLQGFGNFHSLVQVDICNGKYFYAWDQVAYLKYDNFSDYRTAVKIWCNTVVNRYGHDTSVADLLDAIGNLPKTCKAMDPKDLSTDIRKLRVLKSEKEISGEERWIRHKLTDDSVLDPFISPIYELLLESPNLWCMPSPGTQH